LPRAWGDMNQQLERAVQYRAQAAELIRRSDRQTDERQRAVMLDLAATHLRMAEQIEEIHRRDIEPDSKTRDE